MTWTTDDEIRFIRGLGYNRNYAALLTEEQQLDYLKGYNRGALLRKDWGQMNRASVLQFVADRIRQLTTQPKQEGDKT